MSAEYDVFFSYAHADGRRAAAVVEALCAQGLRVWFDEREIADWSSITRSIEDGLAYSKALLAYYSATYPRRRACQAELTAAFIAAQSEGNPRKRILVVNPEVGATHIHPIELRDALSRRAPAADDAQGLATLADSVAEHVRALSGLLGKVRAFSPPRWFGWRGLGSARFVGRVEELWQIHSHLNAGESLITTRARTGLAQVRGLGGVGKSLLAEEYALRFCAAYPGGVFWLRALGNDDSRATLGAEELEAERQRQVQQFAAGLGVVLQGRSLAEIEGALWLAIEKRGLACLWVVDDLPSGMEQEALRRWIAPHPLAKTLITTRSREYGGVAGTLDLGVLSPGAAYDLLTARRMPRGKAAEEAARGLLEDLGHHALAIDVAGAALDAARGFQSFGDFRAALARPTEDELELAAELADTLPNGHEKSIAATLSRSIDRIGAEGLDFLRLASVLAPAPVPGRLVAGAFGKADAIDEDGARRRALRGIAQAEALSLADRAPEGEGARAVHALVSRTVRFRHADRDRCAALRRAVVNVLWEALPEVADPRTHGSLVFEVVHARELSREPRDVAEAELLGWVARYEAERGAHASAEALYQRQKDALGALLGDEHRDTLISMGNLAETLRAQGDYAGARELQVKVLDISRRVLGEEHRDTLSSMNNLAGTLGAQGNHAEARQLQVKVLEIRRRVLGEEHRATLTSINNLATTLQAQGDYAGARELQVKVLDISRRVLGKEHPDTLNSMGNLAGVLGAQGDYAGALDLQAQVFAIRRRVLGEEHPATLTSMNNLALTLEAEGNHAEAQALQVKVVELFRRVLGEEHPATLSSMNNLAGTLGAQGDHAEARELQVKVLEIRRQVFGEEHPATLNSMNNLGKTLQAQGDYAGAQELQVKVVELCRPVLGDEHPNTLMSMGNLAETLGAQGNHVDAQELQVKVLEISRRVLGNEHPDTLTSMSKLADTLRAQGDHAGAQELHVKVLEIFRRVLGEEHLATLTSMNNLALTFGAQGDYAGARELHAKALEISGRVLGEEHPDTSISALNLVETFLQLGNASQARLIFNHHLSWLLNRDPATLGAHQREIRDMLARALQANVFGGADPCATD